MIRQKIKDIVYNADGINIVYDENPKQSNIIKNKKNNSIINNSIINNSIINNNILNNNLINNNNSNVIDNMTINDMIQIMHR